MADLSQMQMPITNQAAADRATAASQVRMQSNLAMTSGQAMMTGPRIAQAAAGQQAQEQAQIASQYKQAEIQNSVADAQEELFRTELRMKEQQTIRSEEMARRHTAQRNQMAALGRDVKQQLLDDQLYFDRTAREARFRTERQLADFMALQTREEQAFADYEQHVKSELEKDLIMMESAYKTLVQAEQQEFEKAEMSRDRELLQKIKEYKAMLEAKAREARRNANRSGRITGAVKVAVGAVAMYYTGGAVGGSLVASGAQEYAAAEGADDDVSLGRDDTYDNSLQHYGSSDSRRGR